MSCCFQRGCSAADRLTPEFDHLLLLVDTGEQLIADIGFGDSFIEPLGFLKSAEILQAIPYRLIEADSDWILQQQQPLAAWQTQYKFTLRPRQLADFRPMSLSPNIPTLRLYAEVDLFAGITRWPRFAVR